MTSLLETFKPNGDGKTETVVSAGPAPKIGGGGGIKPAEPGI